MNRIVLISLLMWYLLPANTTFAFSRQDTLRGANGTGRNWWDVSHYVLNVYFDTAARSIAGSNTVTAKVITTPSDSLQLDLQELMFLDSVVMNGKALDFSKEGDVWWIIHPFHELPLGTEIQFTAYYHGKPHVAKLPPWDGGFIWTKDSTGNPWIAVACQGFGASSWWPCKDYQGDEPDSGMKISVTAPEKFEVVCNGRLTRRTNGDTNVSVWKWQVVNPINTYNASFYIGNYTSWTDTLMGEKGMLDLSYYVLKQNETKARKQFAVVKQMLHCYEYWMGPYPFYEDGYKLVDAPYLGMEHQSAVAYGNEYKMGYLGRDRSNTGVGLLFDYIIIHETGHEWFGNNITARDIADNWLHEGFTTYTEALFTECAFGRDKAFEFTRGEWKSNIRNDRPLIGEYGVNDDGSSDKYDKGAAVVHMIRMIINDDERFRQLLRGLNKDFYHKIVTSAQVEEYISSFAGRDLTPFFNQYLRSTRIPELEWYVKKKQLFFRFRNVVDGFTLPVPVTGRRQTELVNPSAEWQSIKWTNGFDVRFSEDFLFRPAS